MCTLVDTHHYSICSVNRKIVGYSSLLDIINAYGKCRTVIADPKMKYVTQGIIYKEDEIEGRHSCLLRRWDECGRAIADQIMYQVH